MTASLSLYDVSDDAALADSIGRARAELDSAKKTLEGLELIAKNTGQAVLEGDAYRVSISRVERKTVGWKAIAEKLGASRQLITAHSKAAVYDVVRCSALRK